MYITKNHVHSLSPATYMLLRGTQAMSWQNGSLQGGTNKGPLPTGTISKNLTPHQLHQDWKPGKEFSGI